MVGLDWWVSSKLKVAIYNSSDHIVGQTIYTLLLRINGFSSGLKSISRCYRHWTTSLDFFAVVEKISAATRSLYSMPVESPVVILQTFDVWKWWRKITNTFLYGCLYFKPLVKLALERQMRDRGSGKIQEVIITFDGPLCDRLSRRSLVYKVIKFAGLHCTENLYLFYCIFLFVSFFAHLLLIFVIFPFYFSVRQRLQTGSWKLTVLNVFNQRTVVNFLIKHNC